MIAGYATRLVGYLSSHIQRGDPKTLTPGPRTRSVVEVRGPGVSVFGLPYPTRAHGIIVKYT